MLYQIIRSKKFDAQSRLLTGSFARWNDFDSAIDWYLSRDPTREFHIEHGFYLWVTDRLPIQVVPPVSILYHVNDITRTVTLCNIKLQY